MEKMVKIRCLKDCPKIELKVGETIIASRSRADQLLRLYPEELREIKKYYDYENRMLKDYETKRGG
uniref:Uncharacterized protein n=1 Tax=viral metagenome TaxID=1070528 RepID=A0A6M3KMW6_9ZZZZ